MELPSDPAAIAAAYGYDRDEIAIAEGVRIPPKDYLLLHQGTNWCAFVDDFARQERGLRNCFIVMFKPDVIRRGLQGILLQEWIAAGFIMEDMMFYQAATADFWRLQYRELEDKPDFQDLIEAVSNRPIMVFGFYQPGVERASAIVRARELMVRQRTKYGEDSYNNSVHVSCDETAAQREGTLWLYGTKNIESLPIEEREED